MHKRFCMRRTSVLDLVLKRSQWKKKAWSHREECSVFSWKWKTQKFHDAVSGFHLTWYFTVLFDWTYVGYFIRKLVRLTITCVLWIKRSRMQKTYPKLFKHFQWSVCNVALDPLVTLLVAMSKKSVKYLSSLTTSKFAFYRVHWKRHF